MEEVIEAALVCQAQHFSKDIFGVMLEKGVEENVTQSTVFLSLVLAEVHEPLDVKVGSDELNILEAEMYCKWFMVRNSDDTPWHIIKNVPLHL